MRLEYLKEEMVSNRIVRSIRNWRSGRPGSSRQKEHGGWPEHNRQQIDEGGKWCGDN